MRAFEYSVQPSFGGFSLKEIEDHLNELGKDGWQLTFSDGDNLDVYIREVQEA